MSGVTAGPCPAGPCAGPARIALQPGREALVRHRWSRILFRAADDALAVRIHLASADAADLLRDRAVRGLYRHRGCASLSITSTTDTDENRWRSLPAPRVFNREDGIIIQQSSPHGTWRRDSGRIAVGRVFRQSRSLNLFPSLFLERHGTC